MQRAVKAMRAKLAAAGDEGVPKAEALAVAAELKSMLSGPPPPAPPRSRPASSVKKQEAGAGAGAGEMEAAPEVPTPAEEEVAEAKQPALDAAFFGNLEAFVSPEGGFCGESAPLAAFLAEALAARCL